MSRRQTEISIAVASLSDEDKLKMISEFEELEATGCIDTCALRTLACSFTYGTTNVVLYMNQIGNECYRYFAGKYFNERLNEKTY